jgi:hypothetical protein
MAFTGSPAESDQRAMAVVGPQFHVKDGWFVTHGKWTHTASQGAGVGEINIVTLPAGKKLIDTDRSWVRTSGVAFVEASDLHIGFRAYNKPDTNTALQAVAQDDNYFADDRDVGGAPLDESFTLPGGEVEIDSDGLFHLYVMIDTADISEGSIIEVWVVWKPQL